MTNPASIPILPADPKANYLAHQAEIDAAVQNVLKNGWYILGGEVKSFEAEFAAFLGSPHALGVASGTDAITLALRTLGIGPGDGVFTVSHTAVATVAAIELAGATPVLVDIDPETFTMAPASLAAALEKYRSFRQRAVIPVHLYGHPADLRALCDLAARHQAVLIEDCAQAHGASLRPGPGRELQTVGTFGQMAAFSFYPTKNLGALGDGGAVTTQSLELAEKAALVREYGWKERYLSLIPGMNSRLDEIQAAILRVKLRHLAAENQRRRELAALYRDGLRNTPLELPREKSGCHHVYHQFVVRSPHRDKLRADLRENGVSTLIHYPLPVHLQTAYQNRVPLTPGGLPVTEQICREILSLPMHPQLSDADAGRVVECLRKIIK